MRLRGGTIVCLLFALGATSVTGSKLPPLDSSALLLVDLQEEFLGADHHLRVKETDSLMARIGDLLESYRSRGLLVVHLRETAPPWWEGDPTHATELDTRLAPRKGEPVVDKEHADAFQDTNLLELLEARSVDTLVVVGVTTETCVRATACRATRVGFTVVVPQDGTASNTWELHRVALDDMRSGCAHVTTVREIRDILPPTPAPSPH